MNTATLGASPPVNPVPLRQDATVIGLVGLAHGTSHFSHLLLAPLFPVFIRDFGLSFADVGLLMTVFFVISGVGQALSGFLVDRVGARPVLFAAIGCFLVASLVASQVDSHAGLMLVAVIAGIGNARKLLRAAGPLLHGWLGWSLLAVVVAIWFQMPLLALAMALAILIAWERASGSMDDGPLPVVGAPEGLRSLAHLYEVGSYCGLDADSSAR